MIKRSPAFTLMEVILAIALSSTVLVFLARTMGNFYRISRLANEKMSISRQLLLTFDVLEKDISSAYLPDDPKDKKQEDDQQASEKKEEKKYYFMLKAKKHKYLSVKKKSIRRFKSLSLVTTHAFSMPNESPIVPVRVSYELVKEKKRDQEQKSYRLVRAQTTDIRRESSKANDESPEQRMTILENIKQLSLWVPSELVLEEKAINNHLELTSYNKKREHRLFNWGLSEDTQHKIPVSLKFYVELWNDDYSAAYSNQGFGFEIPIVSWNDELERRKKEFLDKKKIGNKHDQG